MSHNCSFIPEEHFFVIDSQNLEQTKTKLYGFTIVQNQLVRDCDSLPVVDPQGDGAYVFVKRTADTLRITQDFIGAYGLYLYRDGDYFAISNSFLRLVDHIKASHKISLNQDYANFFLCAEMCSVAYQETIIREIQCLDRSAEVEIHIPSRALHIRHIDYLENSLELDSEAGMQALDSWYRKWTGFIRNLYADNQSIQFDLSGGFDSRVTFGLALGSGIDLRNILVNSLNDDLKNHAEDFAIATQISQRFRFPLNDISQLNPLSQEFENCSLEEALSISLYLKLCFHTQMYYRYGIRKAPLHYFGGSGGECIRDYWHISDDEYIAKALDQCRAVTDANSPDFEDSVRRILAAAFTRIRSKYEALGRKIPKDDEMLYFYRETRGRNHFGKDIVENYLGNSPKYAPLLDPLLHRLKRTDETCPDNNLLMAVLFTRYFPELLDFPFDMERSIHPDTLAYAAELSRKYPLSRDLASPASAPPYIPPVPTETELAPSARKRIPRDQISNLLQDLLASSRIRSAFESMYGKELYEKFSASHTDRSFLSLQNAHLMLAISKILQDVMANEVIHDSLVPYLLHCQAPEVITNAWPSGSLNRYLYPDTYTTARIDLVKTGDTPGALELISISDVSARIIEPTWLKGNSCGRVIESTCGKLHLQLRSIQSGELTVAIRGKDIHTTSRELIPFWIDLRKVLLNEASQIRATRKVCYGSPLRFKVNVQDGDVLDLYLEWSPHNEVMYNSGSISAPEPARSTDPAVASPSSVPAPESKSARRPFWKALGKH